jgi:putative ABC transport system ATP-binding protein
MVMDERQDIATTAVPASCEVGTVTGDGGEAVVRARDISRRFGSGDAAVDALRGVSLDLARGQFTAVMGPSGSGKSTMMHILAGLDEPTSGTVVIDGTEITSLKERALTQLRRDKIGFIFQTFNLLPMLTAEENMVLPLTIAGRKPDVEMLETLVKTVGLEDRRTHRPAELSGGQQQKVAIARALIGRPAVIFADEPTGNLDSRSGDEVLAMLRRSADDLGQTIVMVTHDARAAAIADRVVFLQDGRIVLDCGHMSRDEIFDTIKDLESTSVNGGEGASV